MLLAAPTTRVFAIQLIGFAGFWALVAALLRPTAVWSSARRLSIPAVSGVVVLSLLFALFTWWYLSQYHFIPTWDRSTYWHMTLKFNDVLARSPIEAFHGLVVSILYYNYNDLMSWVLALPVSVLRTWQGTVGSVAVLFNIPAAFIIALFIKGRVESVRNAAGEPLEVGAAMFAALFACLLLVPAVMRPTFDGIIDAPAYVLFLAVSFALIDDGFPTTWRRALTVGIGVCGTFLLRRYFFYGVMGVAAGTMLYWIAALARTEPAARPALFKRLLRGLAIIVAVFAVVAVVFARFIYRSVFGGNQTQYQAYFRFDSLGERLGEVVASFGWLWIAAALVALAGLVAVCLRRSERPRGLIIAWASCLVAMIVALAMFWQTQDLGAQHWYIFSGQLCMAVFMPIVGVLALLGRRGSMAWRAAFPVAAALLSAAGFAQGFTVVPAYASGLLPQAQQTPYYQADYDERAGFIDYLTDLCGADDSVYFAVASWDYNSTLPIGAVLPDSVEYPFQTVDADVDRRDGFNTDFFEATYVVASDPAQTHLAAGEERIVEALNELVQDGESFVGVHYEPLESFTFDDGVTLTVYRRISDFSDGDVREMQALFDGLYPDLPEMFHDRFEEYLAER